MTTWRWGWKKGKYQDVRVAPLSDDGLFPRMDPMSDYFG